MNDRCDLYLVVPCSFTGDGKLIKEKSDEPDAVIALNVIRKYQDIAEIVLTEQFANRIRRKCLSIGLMNIFFSKSVNDDCEKIVYPISCAIQSQWQPSQARTGENLNQVFFCTLTIILHDVFAKDIIPMLNSVTRDLITVSTSGVTKKFNDWLSDFALEKTAAIKTAVFSSTHPGEENLHYMLAAEEPNEAISFTSSYIKDRACFNIAQYSSATIFASDAVVLEIPEKFKNSFEERIFGELATIFVIEIHVQRIAFLGYFEGALDKISAGLSVKSLPSITALNNVVISAMDLWRTNIYRYILARTIYDEIGKAFRVEQNFKQLNDGKALLEQLVEILKLTSDEKENKKLNALLLFLAAMQVFPFFNSITAAVIRNEVEVEDLRIAFVSIVLTIFVYWIYKYLNK